MAINKANSPVWVKVTLIVLIIAFALSFVIVAANPFSAPTTDQTAATTTTSESDTQFQGTVAALTSQLQSEPESYTVLVSLGNAYFDWAAQKQQESQTSTSAVGADLPLWSAAKDAYSRAAAINDTEPAVMTDFAITLFYTGDTTNAIKVAEAVLKIDPNFSPAHFNLAIFYQATGENDKAIASFEEYLKLDPNGENGGSPDYAKQQISALKGSATPITQP